MRQVVVVVSRKCRAEGGELGAVEGIVRGGGVARGRVGTLLSIPKGRKCRFKTRNFGVPGLQVARSGLDGTPTHSLLIHLPRLGFRIGAY